MTIENMVSGIFGILLLAKGARKGARLNVAGQASRSLSRADHSNKVCSEHRHDWSTRSATSTSCFLDSGTSGLGFS